MKAAINRFMSLFGYVPAPAKNAASVSTLKIDIDSTSVDTVLAKLNKLTKAAHRAKAVANSIPQAAQFATAELVADETQPMILADRINSNSLSNAFTNARIAAGIEAEEGRTAPTFHEIRSLAERLYREQYGKDFAQALLGHKTASMTEKYDDLRGQGWQKVSAK